MIKENPIFLTGADRSGTSLMFALLASHPNISMVRRTNMWRWFYTRYGELSRLDNFERCLTEMLQYKRLGHLKPDPDRIRQEFWQGEPTYGRLFALFHEHNAKRRGKPRWGDKSLHAEHYADQIFKEFPEAKVIHMIRDPRDRYASVLKRYDGTMRGVASTTGRWLASTKMAKRNRQRYPDNYMVVRYETLAYHPEDTLKKVCAFIEEAYTADMLTMDGAPEHGKAGGNSSFGQFEPGVISTRSIGRFRKVLSKRQRAFIQICARRDMAAFGYQIEPIQFVNREKLAFYVSDLPLSLIRMFSWLTIGRLNEMNGKSMPDHHSIQEQQLEQFRTVSKTSL